MHLFLRETPSSHGFLRRQFQAVISASALLVLAACGGGGGGGGNDPPAPPATNAPPTVNAGTDASITLPATTVSLTGSATDDGPASSLVYTWSGPAGVTFAAPNSAATDATLPATAGPYTLTLSVGDGTQTATDTVVITVNPAGQSADVWPDDDTSDTLEFRGWAKVDAASVGMNQDLLDDAEAFAKTVPAGAVEGNGMIVRRGQLVHFWGDIDNAQPDVKSVTKSMGGIALGLAIDDGLLAPTLADKALDKVPTFATPPDINSTKGRELITIGMLATHTAGFPKLGSFQEIQFQPGTTWFYSDGGLNWLADVLTELYRQDLATVLNTEVWSKIGLRTPDDIRWRSMASPGHFRPDPRPTNPTVQYRELASGIQANVNAMARVGLLFLRKGMWKDQRILSEAFVERVHTPLPENQNLALPEDSSFPGALTDYGVLWWTNKSKLMTNVPEDAFWAWGLGEALIVVIPSLDLVITRNGGQASPGSSPGARVWNDDNWNGDPTVLEGFLDPIVAATTP
jgi:CubicO group peptidase (beta-lactamase class C family)